MTHSGIMLGQNIQQQFYLPTCTKRMSSSNMVNTLLADSSPTLTPCSTLNMILPPKSSSTGTRIIFRSEEHTSELQSHSDLVCRLLLEKKKKTNCHTRVIYR